MYLLKNYIQRLIDRIFFGKNRVNYRESLFQELLVYSPKIKNSNANILEIGSRDGEDTKRLITLNPNLLTLVDLPLGKQNESLWFKELSSNHPIKGIYGNIAYDNLFKNERFELIWCTGVLYHNSEQLRFLRQLYDLLQNNGILVLESATSRNPKFKNDSVVEIIYPFSEEYMKKYHISKNVTHLPTKKAIKSQLEMLGFEKILESKCYIKQSLFLGEDRGAFICIRPEIDKLKRSVVKKQSTYPYGRAL